MSDNNKLCTRCGTVRPRSEYWKCHSNDDGLQIWCKPCFRESRKLMRQRRRVEAEMRKPTIIKGVGDDEV
jgi:hypothetical protein